MGRHLNSYLPFLVIQPHGMKVPCPTTRLKASGLYLQRFRTALHKGPFVTRRRMLLSRCCTRCYFVSRMNADPYTIRIFVPNGDPQGVRVIDRMNWTGQGIVFPREKWPERSPPAWHRVVFAETAIAVSPFSLRAALHATCSLLIWSDLVQPGPSRLLCGSADSRRSNI